MRDRPSNTAAEFRLQAEYLRTKANQLPDADPRSRMLDSANCLEGMAQEVERAARDWPEQGSEGRGASHGFAPGTLAALAH